MASSFESKKSRICCRVSPELVQPMSGSISRGLSSSNTRVHSLARAMPDCMAFLGCLKIRTGILSVPVELHGGAPMVGAAGFEPATLCSQSRCATRLRYAPPKASAPVRYHVGSPIGKGKPRWLRLELTVAFPAGFHDDGGIEDTRASVNGERFGERSCKTHPPGGDGRPPRGRGGAAFRGAGAEFRADRLPRPHPPARAEACRRAPLCAGLRRDGRGLPAGPRRERHHARGARAAELPRHRQHLPPRGA